MSNSVIKDEFSINTYEPDILNTFTNIAATTVNAYKDEYNNHLDLTLGASSNVNIEALNNVRVYFDDQSSLQLFNSTFSNNVRIDTELLDISQSMNNTYIYTSNQPLIISGQDGVHTTQISQTVFTDSNDYQLLQTSQVSGFQLGTQVVLASNLIVDKDIVAYENLALGGNLFVPTMNIYKNTEASVSNNMQNQIAYGFYINEFDQLELVKYNKYTSNLNLLTNISRVATFGSNIHAKVGNLNNYTTMNQFTGVLGSPSNISSNNSGSTVGMTAMGWAINADKKRIYYSASNVGIYTQDPKYALDVVGDVCLSKRLMSMSNIGAGTSNPRAPLHVEGMSYFNGEMRTTGRFMTTSNMGVGSSNPQAQLHVVGNSIFEGDIIPGGNGIYNLGSSNNRFGTIYVSANTIDIDGTLITRNGTDGTVSFVNSNGNNANITTGKVTIANSNVTFLIDIVDDKLYTYQSNASGLTPVSLIQNVSISGSNVGINKAVPIKALDVVGDANLTGNMVIGGDLTVMGNTTTVNTENVLIKDNIMTLNSSQTGVPASTLKSGIEIERGTESNYMFVFDESVAQFKVGMSNSLKAIVSASDTLTSGFTYFDNSNKLLTNRDITLSDFPTLEASIAYGSNLSRDSSNALYPQATFASNNAVWGSNKSITDSNNLYSKSMYASNVAYWASNNGGTWASNTAYFSSNLAVTSSNALYPQAIFASNLVVSNSNALYPQTLFASNLAVTASNALYPQALFASNLAVTASNALYPQALFASNLAVTSSNALYPQALFASNTGVWGSNKSVADSNILYPQALFASNTGVWGSNKSVTDSNILYPQVFFASNTGVWASNLAAIALTHSSNLSDLTNIATAQNNLGLGTSCNVTFNTINTSGDILPTVTLTQNIGSSNLRFNNMWVNDLHLGVNSLYLGDTKILGTTATTVDIKADRDQSVNVNTSGVGHTQISSVAGIDINATNGSIISSASNGSIQFNTVGTNRSIALTAEGASSRVSIAAGTEINIASSNTAISGNASVGTNLIVSNNLTVGGDVTIMGSNFIANVQTVQVRDNIMLLNSGQTGSGVSSCNGSGIEIDRGDSAKYRLVFKESSQMFVMGAAGNEEIIASQNYVGTNALWKSSNLAELTNSQFARNNLGLGATCNVTFSNLTVADATLTSVNNVAFVNGAFGSNAGAFGSNYAVWSSNKAVDASNAIFPQALFASNYAVWSSNKAVDASNAIFPQALFASNAGSFGSNYAVWSSNKAIDSSNAIFPQVLFASNYAVWSSNTAVWASNNGGAWASNTAYWASNNLSTSTGVWTANSSNVYIIGSNLGVGTSTPTTMLESAGTFAINRAQVGTGFGIAKNIPSGTDTWMKLATTTESQLKGSFYVQGTVNYQHAFYKIDALVTMDALATNISSQISTQNLYNDNGTLWGSNFDLVVITDSVNTTVNLYAKTKGSAGNIIVNLNVFANTKNGSTATKTVFYNDKSYSLGFTSNMASNIDTSLGSNYAQYIVSSSTNTKYLSYTNTSGNIGINNIAPTYQLDVIGDINTSTTLRSVTHSNSGNLQVGTNLYVNSSSNITYGNGIGLKNALLSGNLYSPIYSSNGASNDISTQNLTIMGYGSTTNTALSLRSAGNELGVSYWGVLKTLGTGEVSLDALQDSAAGNVSFIQFKIRSQPIMTLATSCNVGIGTTTPSYKLDVAGDINTSTTLRSVTHSNSGNMQVGGTLSTKYITAADSNYGFTTIGNTTTQINTLTLLNGLFSGITGVSGAWGFFASSYVNSYASSYHNGQGGLISGTSGWIQLKFPSTCSVTTYTIMPSATLTYAPTTWTLQGANDVNFKIPTILDTQTGITTWAASTSKTFTIASPQTFLYYRLNFTALNGGGLFQINNISYVGNMATNILNTTETYLNGNLQVTSNIQTQGAFTAETLQINNNMQVGGRSYLVGNVGIGTSNPNAQLQLANTVSNRRIVLWEDANNDHQYSGFGINSGILRYQVGSTTNHSHVFYAASNSNASTELFRIMGTGKIGIGNSSPSASFDMKGISTSSSSNQRIIMDVSNSLTQMKMYPITNSNYSGLQIGQMFGYDNTNINFDCSYDGSWIYSTNNTNVYSIQKYQGVIKFNYGGIATGAGSNITAFHTTLAINQSNIGIGTISPSYPLDVIGDICTSTTLRSVTFSNSGNMQVGGRSYLVGNVGIGTTNPISPLHIIGSNIRINPTSGTEQNLSTYYIASTSGAGDGSPTVGFFGTSNYGNVVINTEAWSAGAPTSAASILFKNNGSEKMRLHSNGYLGIGTTNPTVQLDLSTDGARKLTTSTWATGSDSRVKENIEDANLDMCYSNLKSINLKRFQWNSNLYPEVDDRNTLGWIAQDVQEVYPKAVYESESFGFSNFLNLNSDIILKTVYGALRKTIDIVESQAITISNLESRIIQLESR